MIPTHDNTGLKPLTFIFRGPMGTGKTLVGAWVVDALGANGVAVVVLPTIVLADQALQDYQESVPTVAHGVADCQIVASDSANKGKGVSCTTDPTDIGAIISQHDGRRIIFATYDSLERVGDALRLSGLRASIVVFDEAHLMANRARKYTAGLDDTVLNATARLFLTGTYRDSMDHRDFGPCVYRWAPLLPSLSDARLVCALTRAH